MSGSEKDRVEEPQIHNHHKIIYCGVDGESEMNCVLLKIMAGRVCATKLIQMPQNPQGAHPDLALRVMGEIIHRTHYPNGTTTEN